MSKKMEQKSLKIKEDDKFFNRLMSKDLALSSSLPSNNSSRHYYVGASSAVPFMWESRPGTPKHVIFSDNSSLIPPLTPPPSYNSKSSMQLMNNTVERESKMTWLTNFIFLSWKTIIKSSSSSTLSSNCSPSSSLRSSSWSSSSIESKNPPPPHHQCRRGRRLYPCFTSRSGGDHVHDYNDEDDEDEVHDQQIGSSASGLSPNTTLCFGGVINKRKKIVMNGYCRFENIKSALLSIAGRRSA